MWHDEDYEVDFCGDDAQRRVAQVGQFNTELETAGAWLFAGGLQPASSATLLQSEDGQITTISGPYAKHPEQMGGFWIIEASDHDTALEGGRQAAMACEGSVEVRPLRGEPGRHHCLRRHDGSLWGFVKAINADSVVNGVPCVLM